MSPGSREQNWGVLSDIHKKVLSRYPSYVRWSRTGSVLAVLLLDGTAALFDEFGVSQTNWHTGYPQEESTKLTLTEDMPVKQPKPPTRGNGTIIQQEGTQDVRVLSIPKELFDGTNERQCRRNHNRGLESMRLAGGLHATEVVSILANASDTAEEYAEEYRAHRILYAWIAHFRRGMMLGREELQHELSNSIT